MPPFTGIQPKTPFDMGQTGANPTLTTLFKAVDKRSIISNNYIKKGSLISFGYARWVHDPYPLVLVTDVLLNNRIRGVNLHYLTFPYIRNILRLGSNNPAFSYLNIKGDRYIVNAFRSYKWQGIRQISMLDSAFLLTVMAAVRSFDPSQVKAIRRAVQEQIRRQVNPVAAPTGPMPLGQVTPAPAASVGPAVPMQQTGLNGPNNG